MSIFIKKYHDEILWNIKDSFGSEFANNFSNYDILKKNVPKCLNNIKKRINNDKINGMYNTDSI